ncbi:hypothetical protein [Nocardia sp. bgisy134]|uniref:hypothetical protein n=1 Tax=Nocardia sp. bgisy134 TaxID=3413789 RepID=UPI003D715925
MDLRNGIKSAISNAAWAAGAIVVTGILLTAFTAALSDVAAAGGAIVVVGNTVRTIKSVYDGIKIWRVLAAAAAAAGGAAVIANFDKVPSATDIGLAAIISMKVFIDEALDDEIDEDGPAYNFEGTGYSLEELAEFARGHAGDDNPAMGRPTMREIEEALRKGTTSPGSGNSVRYDYNGVRVIINRDVPLKSTTYYPSR